MTAALASLNDKAHATLSKEKNAMAREFTQNNFKGSGIEFIPSVTNFIFFRLKNYQGDFANEMMKKNIVLRSGNYSDGKWGRVSIGTMAEMQHFIKVVKEEFRAK